MTQAYTTLFTAALLILGALMIACLVRAILGPRIADRLVSINMTGTIAIMIGRRGARDNDAVCDLRGVHRHRAVL